MDMQNVSNLQIPEGAVRTIHDKNNRLLWGRVAYDAKYAGDTLQNGTPTPDTPIPVQTVTGEQTVEVHGKNLLDVNGISATYRATKEIVNGSIKSTATANGTGYTSIVIPNSNDLLGKQCTISYNAQTSSGEARFRIFTAKISAPATLGSGVTTIVGNGYKTTTFTFPASYDGDKDCFVVVLYPRTDPVTSGDYAIYSNIQLEQGSTATTYEPYQGQNYNVDLTSKNLWNFDTNTENWQASPTVLSPNSMRLTGTANSGGQYTRFVIPCESSTTYVLSRDVNIVTAGANDSGMIYIQDNNGYITNLGAGGTSKSFTTSATATQIRLVFYAQISGTPTEAPVVEFSNVQIELGQTATDFAPYYNYELCKIGGYQDHIYKSGDDWYVHKETNSLTVTSSMSGLGKSGTSANNAFYLTSQFGDIDRSGMGQGASSTTVTPSYSKYFTIKSANEVFNSDTVGMAFDIYTGTLTDFRVGFGLSSSVNTLNLFKTWLDNNLLKVYYPLAAPTDTQITDTVLISQLNAVHEWMTRYGYNSVVTGNLPIIIDRTSL